MPPASRVPVPPPLASPPTPTRPHPFPFPTSCLPVQPPPTHTPPFPPSPLRPSPPPSGRDRARVKARPAGGRLPADQQLPVVLRRLHRQLPPRDGVRDVAGRRGRARRAAHAALPARGAADERRGDDGLGIRGAAQRRAQHPERHPHRARQPLAALHRPTGPSARPARPPARDEGGKPSSHLICGALPASPPTPTPTPTLLRHFPLTPARCPALALLILLTPPPPPPPPSRRFRPLRCRP